jgi:DNA-binding transcriptional MocR family regulator
MLSNYFDKMSLSATSMAPPPTFLALANQPDIISFAGGVPDADQFPFDIIGDACDEILKNKITRRSALQYAPSTGYLPLRTWLSDYMKSLNINAPKEDVVITNGAQQALDLIAKLLIDPGDVIAVTAPTFFAALETFNVYNPQYAPVPFINGELDMDEFRKAIQKKPKFFYIIPEYQNPTGHCLTLEQRNEIVVLCRENEVLIVEDSAYEQLTFSGKKLASLLSIDQALAAKTHKDHKWKNGVIYVNTFSKTIAPGLRVGWIYSNEPYASKLSALKLSSDVHTSIFNQMLVLKVVETSFAKHIKKIRAIYHTRCQTMLQALSEHMPKDYRWSAPDGGLFIWLELPEQLNAKDLLNDAIETRNIAYVPGEMFYCDGSGKNTCRLSFSTASNEKINEGIERLSRFFIQSSE